MCVYPKYFKKVLCVVTSQINVFKNFKKLLVWIPSLIITSRVFCVDDVVTLSSLLLYIDDDPILN